MAPRGENGPPAAAETGQKAFWAAWPAGGDVHPTGMSSVKCRAREKHLSAPQRGGVTPGSRPAGRHSPTRSASNASAASIVSLGGHSGRQPDGAANAHARRACAEQTPARASPAPAVCAGRFEGFRCSFQSVNCASGTVGRSSDRVSAERPSIKGPDRNPLVHPAATGHEVAYRVYWVLPVQSSHRGPSRTENPWRA